MIRVDIVQYKTHRKVLHHIRQTVFVKEQNIPLALEVDALDPLSVHALALWNGTAAGTGRLTPQGRIGRVAVYPALRRRGVGREIMLRLIQIAQQQGRNSVVISAQWQALPFYQKLGFIEQGDRYLDVGIEHIKMIKYFG
ncbi:MAG: GNAT family N-acetyltransferase [Leptolyngbyaceae cyanobacterium SM1_1_3]|nr:GNAT family N-acetyltransferase [Leptolyngbyaceae cyanobacterium SM1_1_3]NJN01206.1 GNAT family N-acetyltransferase [Leptolyngbyaceae cyanobacterium RM1_1_2]